MKKSLILAGLFALVFACLFGQTAATVIELTSPNVPGIGSTRTVNPTLHFTHVNQSFPVTYVSERLTYRIYISKDPNMDVIEDTFEFTFPSAVGATATDADRTYDIPVARALDYNTVYYWQVRQFVPGTSPLTERQNPSLIGSFRTPRMSVRPIVRWDDDEESVDNPLVTNYLVTVHKDVTYPAPNVLPPSIFTPPGIVVNGGDTHFQVPLTHLLSYDTNYLIRIQPRNASNQPLGTAINKFITTKPLIVIGEGYFYDVAGTFTTTSLPITNRTEIEPTGALRYYVVTDEFENFIGSQMNAIFRTTSNIMYPLPDGLVHDDIRFIATTGIPNYINAFVNPTRSVAMINLPVSAASVIPAATSNQLFITGNDPITLRFEYGRNMIVVPTEDMDALALHSWIYVANSTSITSITPTGHFFDNDVHILFNTVPTGGLLPVAPIGSSKLIHVVNLDTGDIWERYALRASPNHYRLHLTRAAMNAYFYRDVEAGVPVTPFRVRIIPVDEQDKLVDPMKDFIWLGGTPLVQQPASPSPRFGAQTYTINDPINLTWVGVTPDGRRWVRVISDRDPIGFIYNGTATGGNPIRMGFETIPGQNIILAGIDPEPGSDNRIMLRQFNGLEFPPEAPAHATIVPQPYSPFGLIRPYADAHDVSIFPRFEWSSAFDTISSDIPFMTHYLLEISKDPNFPAGTGTTRYTTRNTWFYPEEDLEDGAYFLGLIPPINMGTTYFWRVSVVPGGPLANNLGPNRAWSFQTLVRGDGADERHKIEMVASDRVLHAGNAYIFTSDAVIGPGATLTIPPGTDIAIQNGVTITVYGSIVADGVVFEPLGPNGTWGGFNFVGGNREPLITDSNRNYVSGPLLRDVVIRSAVAPITFDTDADAIDIYLERVFIENSNNGIKIGPGSYVVDTTIHEFRGLGNGNSFGISGGLYFRGVTIDGDIGDTEIIRFVGKGIVTSNINAEILESEIKNMAGNAIEILNPGNLSSESGFIFDNTILNTGTNDRESVAILAANSFTVERNRIGNHTNYALPGGSPGSSTADSRNRGFAIRNGSNIIDNIIVENGNGAIFASVGANVVGNIINNNAGFAIRNGANIVSNFIMNDDGGISENGLLLRSVNGILADPTATVANNTIINTNGFGIDRGSVIVNNRIIIQDPNPSISGAELFSIRGNGADTTVDGNYIENSRGFAISNADLIKDNEINGAAGFGIQSLPGGEVIDNQIISVGQISIENGKWIIDNVIQESANGIRPDIDATVVGNTLTKTDGSLGFAINRGRFVNNNTITGFTTSNATIASERSNGEENIIFSEDIEQFSNNVVGGPETSATAALVNGNLAEDGSIFHAMKTVNTPLIIANNVFENNRYRVNTLRISSMNLEILDNSIRQTGPRQVDAADSLNTGRGGLIATGHVEIDAVPAGEGTAVYIRLRGTQARMEGNQIIGHKGGIFGAALFIESEGPNVANRIQITNKNTISNNHAFGRNGMGAGLYLRSGTVLLGSRDLTPPILPPTSWSGNLGNTITNNSIVLRSGPGGGEIIPPTIAAGAAIHVETADPPITFANPIPIQGTSPHPNAVIQIWRNIITSNRGNWAIYGAPSEMHFNNIYDNMIIQPPTPPDPFDEGGQPIIPDAQNFFYIRPASAPVFSATYNFWGTRSDRIEIASSIFNNRNNPAFGRVEHNPALNAPSQDTPSIVDNPLAPKIFTSVDGIADRRAFIATQSLYNLPSGRILYVAIAARDNNEFSKDFSSVRMTNLNTGQWIHPLLIETDLNSEVYWAAFMLVTPGDHNLSWNWLGANGGDLIRAEIGTHPNISTTFMADVEGSIGTNPNLHAMNFGTWAVGSNGMDGLDRKLTFTNTGETTVDLLNVFIWDGEWNLDVTDLPGHGNESERFEVLNLHRFTTATGAGASAQGVLQRIPPNGSFDVVVRYIPTATAEGPHSDWLHIVVCDGNNDFKSNRRIRLIGSTVALWSDIIDNNPYHGTIVGIHPFGSVVMGASQMTVTAQVWIDDQAPPRWAPIGTLVGAFVVSGVYEELRGIGVVTSTNGVTSIVIQGNRDGEPVYFRVLSRNGGNPLAVRETNAASRINEMILGSTVHRIIRAYLPLDVTGFVYKMEDGETPQPQALVSNVHRVAELNPNTGRSFGHTTWEDGSYWIRLLSGEELILSGDRFSWYFETTPTRSGTPPPPTGQPLFTGIPLEENTGIFTHIPRGLRRQTFVGQNAYMHNADFGNTFASSDSTFINNTWTPLHTGTNRAQAGLNFNASRINYLIVSRLIDPAGNILSNTEITIVLTSGEEIVSRSDDRGIVMAGVPAGERNARIFITQEQISEAGHDHFQLTETPTLLYTIRGAMNADRVLDFPNHLGANLNLQRTQVIRMDPGWNLISFNNDFVIPDAGRSNGWIPGSPVPAAVFGISQFVTLSTMANWAPAGSPPALQHPILEVRTQALNMDDGSEAWEPGGVGELVTVTRERGYYVNVGGDARLAMIVKGKPHTVNHAYTLFRHAEFPQWSLVGYTPGAFGQTRYMVRNNPLISQINSMTEVYFFDDKRNPLHPPGDPMCPTDPDCNCGEPLGHNTLVAMNPNQGYWMQTPPGDVPVNLNYREPDYNNVIRQLRIIPASGNQIKGHVVGVIDNAYLGYPVNHIAPGMGLPGQAIDRAAILEGHTYRIIPTPGLLPTDPVTPPNPANWNNLGARPVVSPANADAFIPPLPPTTALDQTWTRRAEVFTALGDGTGAGLAAMPTGAVEYLRGPKVIRVHWPAGEPLTGLGLQIDLNSLLPDNVTHQARFLTAGEYLAYVNAIYTQGWNLSFGLLLGTGSTEITNTSTHTLLSTAPQYIVVTNVALPADPIQLAQSRVVVYQLIIDEDPDFIRNNANLLSFSLLHNGTLYNAQKNGTVLTLALPRGRNFAGSTQFFSLINRGTNATLRLPDASAGNPGGTVMISGASSTGFTSLLTPLEDMQEIILTVTDTAAGAGAAVDTRPFTLLIYWLDPLRYFDETPVMSPIAYSGANIVHPFGPVRFFRNNHYVLTRVTQNGRPVNPAGMVVAAYVGNELRGISRVMSHNGMTWAPMLVETEITGEEVRFKWFRNDGSGNVFGQPETILTIPGGTTRDFELQLELSTDSDDPIAPVFINEMLPAFPNPFNPSTTIRFSLKNDQHARIDIFNIRGQRVTTLVNEVLEQGHHEVIWHGTTSYGRQAASGVYFIRMQTDGFERVNRALLLK